MHRIALAFALLGALGAMPAVADVPVGGTAPAFMLTDQDGKTVDLSQLAGKVVVLEWTNPGCPFVQRHYKAKTMQTLADRWKGKEVVWLAINSTNSGTGDGNRTWRTEQGFTYAILDDHAGAVGREYGAKTTPHMFVIDPQGKIAYEGAIDDDPMGDKTGEATNYVGGALQAVAAGKAVDPAETKPYGCSVKYAP